MYVLCAYIFGCLCIQNVCIRKSMKLINSSLKCPTYVYGKNKNNHLNINIRTIISALLLISSIGSCAQVTLYIHSNVIH